MKGQKKKAEENRDAEWDLRLYVANTSARSKLAEQNLRALCEHYLHGQYHLRIIDLVKRPELARKHEILATPTLVRLHPGPEKAVIGTLSDPQSVLRALEMGVRPEKLLSELSRIGVAMGEA